MSTFNLFEHESQEAEAYLKKYVTAMGYTHVRNRDQYAWWDYEQLASSPDADWEGYCTVDSSLPKLLHAAGVKRQKHLKDIKNIYGLNPTDAGKVLKTYIGYHPSYGGYICQIGPYLSEGYVYGLEHKKQSGVDKFKYFVLRKRKATQTDVMRSLSKNIKRYNETYGIAFEPSDFAYNIRQQVEEFDPAKPRQADSVIEERVENIDPSSPQGRNFFQRSPMVGIGSNFVLNNNGLAKIMIQLMGPWYEQTLRQKASQENKSIETVALEIASNTNILKDVYDKAYVKWEEARNSGEAAAMGMSPPPRFKDLSLRSRPGQQWFGTLETNEEMKDQMALKIQIIEFLKRGTSDPIDIAKTLNEDPIRVKRNYSRTHRKDPKPPIIITPEEIERHIADINQKMQEKNQDISQVLDETISVSDSMTEKTGYEDLKTAFEMASSYFSSEPKDPVTQTRLGPSTAIIFNPPENFENITSEELRVLRETKEAKDRGELPQDHTATLEDIRRDLGENIPESEKEKIEEEMSTPATPETIQIPSSGVEKDLEELMGRTLQNLIKVAEELDQDNKDTEAEEVHKVIRKYMRGQYDL